MVNWTPEKIREWYDANLDATLLDLSRLTGYTVTELKRILMEG